MGLAVAEGIARHDVAGVLVLDQHVRTAIAPKIGCTPETLRAWHQKHLDQQNPIKVQQISDQEKMKQMEREIKELKRANEILRKAAAFFAQAELDRPHK